MRLAIAPKAAARTIGGRLPATVLWQNDDFHGDLRLMCRIPIVITDFGSSNKTVLLSVLGMRVDPTQFQMTLKVAHSGTERFGKP